MTRATVKATIIDAVQRMGLAHHWQDKPCKLFVVLGSEIRVIDLTKVRSKTDFARVLGRIDGWMEAAA